MENYQGSEIKQAQDTKIEYFVQTSKDGLITVKKTPDQKLDHTYIFIHGLFDSGERMLKLLQSGTFPFPGDLCKLQIILPTAPVREVTKYKRSGHSWYDMNDREFDDPLRYNEDHMRESLAYIISLIDQVAVEFHNSDYSKVYLGGFSQGCLMSFLAAISFPKRIGGIIGYSGIVPPIAFKLIDENPGNLQHLQTLPFLQYVGVEDPLFPIEKAKKQAEEFWKELLNALNFKFVEEAGLGHKLSQKGLMIGNEFIESTIKQFQQKL
ncbi:hypothetical protein FGO68_gene15620 [Halteria grandinella]|uniref:Phospholipase/carboxylesterase/thioesterase domain-containing protein n=1 Tax=Halteria grandinella TaxID=5974 RepID=A0A8J8NIW3_HALGN|nr:hypothetical protein FGO68_gene15620 [Halteria grandinella]